MSPQQFACIKNKLTELIEAAENISGGGGGGLVGSIGGNGAPDDGKAALFSSGGQLIATDAITVLDTGNGRSTQFRSEDITHIGDGSIATVLDWNSQVGNRTFQLPVEDGILASSNNLNVFTRLQTITQGTANEGILASTGYSLTGANAQSMIDLAGTVNTSGRYDALKLALTNTAGGAGSSFASFLVGSAYVARFPVGLTGELQLYKSYTDESNYNRVRLASNDGFYANSPGLIVEKAGTGGDLTFNFINGTTGGFAFWTNATLRWNMDGSGHLIAGADNAYDIGAAGATRPRNIYAGGIIQGDLTTAVNATTGLVAGTLAATTNASIVIKDASGQAYRIPCII